MVRKAIGTKLGMLSVILSLLMSFSPTGLTSAQQESPTLRDPNLGVRSVVSGLTTPISMAFLGPNEFFVLEKILARYNMSSMERFRTRCLIWRSIILQSVV